MTALPEQAAAWVTARTGAPVVGVDSAALPGGAFAGRVELLRVRTAGGAVCELVRKTASGSEIHGLRAAQRVRAGTVIPEIVAAGPGADGPWLITPFYPGVPLAGAAPAELFTALAHLHAAYRDTPVDRVPAVDPAWWRSMLQNWALPAIDAARHRHPAVLMDRIDRLLRALARHPVVADVLEELPSTLLHGDVHPGNILLDEHGRPQLIDWGSARRGPAALDLANISTVDGPGVAGYRRAIAELTGAAPDEDELRRGFDWAGLQIPVQHLPWGVGHLDTTAVTDAVEGIECALARLA